MEFCGPWFESDFSESAESFEVRRDQFRSDVSRQRIPFHERDAVPRVGDIAVQKFTAGSTGGFEEQTVWADVFDANWRLNDAK